MTIEACLLYLISPLDVTRDFPAQLQSALAAAPENHKVAAFQLRIKGYDDQHEAARIAAPLREICAAHDCAFIVNDDVSLAKRLKADGVHLGRDDMDIKEARAILGPDMQIGATCHDSRHYALEAGEKGADYVAFGAFYPSLTKEVKHIAELELLQWWAQMVELPSVAIGGITPENAQPIIEAGADFIAVSSGVWQHPKGVAHAVNAFAEIFTKCQAEMRE